MIAADTSTWIAFFQGAGGTDVELLDQSLANRQVLMIPPVLTELLSDPSITSAVSLLLSELPLVDTEPGFWTRAGCLRARVIAKGRKARLGDSLIAQSCIDAALPLLTRDRDFQAFAEAASLSILLEARG